MFANSGLDTGFLISTDNIIILLQGFTLPLLLIKIKHPASFFNEIRVSWVNPGSIKPRAHRGKPFAKRLKKKWPNAIPVHASWLNQIEIYFSIVQRKVLIPNDFPRLEAVKERLINF